MIPKAEPQHIGETSAQKRGGTGTRRQASPDPREPHIPNTKGQGVW